MTLLPTAVVISDFPIVTQTADGLLRPCYRIVSRTWASYVDSPVRDACIAICDVTGVGEGTALAVLTHTLPGARIILCSLHRNEVDVFRPAPAGYVAERAFSSLLDVSTCGRL